MKNRKHIAWAQFVLNQEKSLEPEPSTEASLVAPAFRPVLVAR
jgi:hypothetical protein